MPALNSRIDRFEVMALTLEVANDVVAFDSHVVLLERDRVRDEPTVLWDFETGPSYAGREFERFESRMPKLAARWVRTKSANKTGMVSGKRRLCVVRMSYRGTAKGILVVWRDSSEEFSTADMRLLRAIGDLAAAAMCEQEALDLLKRLRFYFLDRRTAASQAKDAKAVLEQYLDKAERVIHPELFRPPRGEPSRVPTVRSTAKLITVNGTALYIAAYRSSSPRNRNISGEWSPRRLSTRYVADGKSSIAARVFATRRPYWTNRYKFLTEPVTRLFRNVKCHMSAPIIAGNEQCYGVLSIESAGKATYTLISSHALALLAGHAARYLGKARDRELAAGRLMGLDVTRDMMQAIQECKSWPRIRAVLARGLRRLRYRRGLICEVRYDQKQVVGSASWGARMRRLCRKTKRHFTRDRNDCQIKTVMTGLPQVISNPKQDRAANREALQMAALGPFAVIPMLNRAGKVMWTLHVEREDTAPIDKQEIADLQGICRAAMLAREHVEDSNRQRQKADIALAWAQNLQRRFRRRRDVLVALADFAVPTVCSRCRVFAIERDRQIGVCYTGPQLERIRDFARFILKPSNARLLSILRGEPRLMVVRRGVAPSGPLRKEEFRIEYVERVSQERILGKEGVPEWVEVPLFSQGSLIAKAVFDKKNINRDRENRFFETDELRLLAALGRLTSLVLERTDLEQDLHQQAALGASVAAFRHELDHCAGELADKTDKLIGVVPTKLRDGHRWLVDLIAGEAKRMVKLRSFFADEVIADGVAPVNSRPVSEEIDRAVSLLGLAGNQSVRLPRHGVNVCVPSTRHALCVILLQLLSNAKNAAETNGKIKVSFERARAGRPHKLAVANTGGGIDEKLAKELRSRGFRASHIGGGLGLRCAQLLAEEQGWILRLARRAKPTRFELCIPIST